MSVQEDFAQARAWAQIDHRLVSLKIQQAIAASKQKADRLPDAPKGNLHGRFVAWAHRSIEQANQSAEREYAIYLDVWEQQHKARTPALLWVVFQRALTPTIDAKVGAAQFNITITAKRIGMTARLSPILRSLAQEKSRLVGQWRNRIEIEARELELKQGSPHGRTYPSEDDLRRMRAAAAAQAATLPPVYLQFPAPPYSDSDRPLDGTRDAKFNPPNLKQSQLYSSHAELARRTTGRPGRPRKDELAEQALRLKAEGKSWTQIGLKLNTNSESIRKLAKSRTRLRRKPPEKTPQ